MRRAQELDPLTPLYAADLGWQYWRAGQYDKAMEEARKSLELNPNFSEALIVLGYAYEGKGMYEEAIAAHQKAGGKGALAVTYALAGRPQSGTGSLRNSVREVWVACNNNLRPRIILWRIEPNQGIYDNS